MKKIISLILCTILCLSLIPVSAFAEEEFEDPFIPVEEDEIFVESEVEAVVDEASDESWYGGWQQIGGKWYYMGSSGAMMTKTVFDYKDDICAVDENGVMVTNRTVQTTDGTHYQFGSDGKCIRIY